MKSPFPGMDPYLEQHWRGVHQNLITFAQGELNDRLPGTLRARVEERVFVEQIDWAEGRPIYPDVHIVERPASPRLATPSLATGENVALAEPVLVEIAGEAATQGYIESWVLAVPRTRIPHSHRTPYQVCVRRAERPLRPEVYYAVPLRQRLPVIPIPLRREDEDVLLDLQSLIDRCYRHGRYDDIDYRLEPAPPLELDDAAWANQLLREAGKR